MTPQQYARARQLFEAVESLPAEARAARLAELCPDDPALRERVLALLAADPARLPPLQALVRDALFIREGDHVGPYRLVRLLGEGGMGEVWLAEQVEPIRRQVALKLIKPGMDSRSVIARFETERQALGLMEHPSIARIYDAGVTPRGLPYFAMEYVDGQPITGYCDALQLSVRERLELFVRVCAGVQHAHQRAILHRDLKPSNVLVRTVDDRPMPTIIDFGIAKALQEPLAARPMRTEAGALIGTPEYMSPERLAGREASPDTRADVYSLGMLLCELLTGRLPTAALESRSRPATTAEIASGDLPLARPSALLGGNADAAAVARMRATSPAALRSRLRRDLDWIVLKATAPEVERRYASALGLAQDVERSLRSEVVEARPPSVGYRALRFVRRHRLGVAVAATIAVLLIGGVAGTTFGLMEARRAEAAARRDAAAAEQSLAFLVSLFKSTDPLSGGGPTLTAKELLDSGIAQLRRDTTLDPAALSRLKQAIGYGYFAAFEVVAAEQLLQEALAEQREIFGADHPQTLRTVRYLAELYWTVGPLEEAERLARQALDGLQRALGADAAESVEAERVLLDVLIRRDQDPTVIERAEQFLARCRAAFGPEALPTAEAAVRLANLRLRAGDVDGAEALLRDALHIRRQRLGPDHLYTLQAELGLAKVAVARGDLAAAEEAYRRAVEVIDARWGPDTKPAYRARQWLAGVLVAGGRLGEARNEYEVALQGYRRMLQADHPDTLAVAHELGRVHAVLGDTDAARVLLAESCDGRRVQFGAAHELTRASCEALAALSPRAP